MIRKSIQASIMAVVTDLHKSGVVDQETVNRFVEHVLKADAKTGVHGGSYRRSGEDIKSS
jgi:dihydrodipicolinate synthase/N-acetylneuraminate lyase